MATRRTLRMERKRMEGVRIMNQMFNSATRKYIYGLCIAAVPVLIYFKLMPAEAAPIILPLVLAILNIQEPEKPAQGVTEASEGHGR